MSATSPDSESSDLQAVLLPLQALRARLAAGTRPPLDPVRLHYVEALARRWQAAPADLQKVLRTKLMVALKDLGALADTDQAAAPPQPVAAPSSGIRPQAVGALAKGSALKRTKAQAQPETAVPAAHLSRLAQLNRHIQAASSMALADGDGHHLPSAGTAGGMSGHPPELKSAVRFRETWARISAEAEVDQAAHRAPENAGPLNSHNLVLRTLSLMRELSPDYLRRFMAHTESLLWLDQAYGQLKQPAAKAKSAKGSPKPPKAKTP